jgi:hypothetical protein
MCNAGDFFANEQRRSNYATMFATSTRRNL